MFETIVALATPPLKSALALVRLSGDNCFFVVNQIFSKDISRIEKKTIFYGEIKDGNNIVDEVVLLAYKGPKSFTGEDSIEIICHGSMLIANKIVDLCLKHGARMATNGEFSSRAFLNGKIDLVQAEAINDIINATTEEARALAMNSLSGETSEMFKPIKDKIAELIAGIEVNIDFPEYEDIEVLTKEKIINYSENIIKLIDNLIKDTEQAKLIRDGIKVAIVGKPNVGKSSLLNAILKEDKAIVTDIAGTTRDVVEGDYNFKGVVLHLLDTAGYRESNDKIESIGIEKTKKAINDADLVIFLKSKDEDEELLEFVKNKNVIFVINKADLIKNKKPDEIYISAEKKDLKNLFDALSNTLNLDNLQVKVSFSNTRQLGLLKNISQHLTTAIKDAKNDAPIDLISVNITAAYNKALELVGESTNRDIQDEIFSRFCVGK